MESTTSDNRSVHRNPYEATETRGSSNTIRNLNDSLTSSASQNQQKYTQQLNSITSGDETHGDGHSEDCAFNETLEGTLNSAARIFNACDPNCSDASLKHLAKCINVIFHQTSLDSRYATESNIQNLSESNRYAEIVSCIRTLALNISYLEYFGSGVRNISALFLNTSEYDKGVITLREFESYLIQLELVV